MTSANAKDRKQVTVIQPLGNLSTKSGMVLSRFFSVSYRGFPQRAYSLLEQESMNCGNP
jgi:hypothetical protein